MDLIVSVPLAFVAGIAAFASPCFLPIVPVFLGSLLGSQASDQSRFPALALASSTGSEGFIDHSERKQSQQALPVARSKGALNAALFVFAFSAVFIGLWVLVALFGWFVADWKQIFLIVGGAVLIVMGLSQVGLLQLGFLERGTKQFGSSTAKRSGAKKSLLMGLAFGLGWSPCIGPTLGAIIGLALTSGSLLAGTGLLVIFCVGLGTPLILLAAGISRFEPGLAWLRKHGRGVKLAAGALQIVVGFLMITNLFSKISALAWITV